MDLKVDEILNTVIDPKMSDFEKELAIHDYIVLNTTYDYDNYQNDTIPWDSYIAYGVSVKGIGVCQGYAESMKLLLNEVSIDCIIVSSPEMNHAWNIITLGGENYHVDARCDDSVPNREGYVRYLYLNTSNEQMKKTHQ